jgi:hypothetical protein
VSKIKRGKFLEDGDVMSLLRSEIERAGGQVRWSKIVGLNRPNLNKMLHGKRPLNKRVLEVLNLRVVFAPDPKRPAAGAAPVKRPGKRKRA